ncbi:iron-binding protein [Alcaligenaceae bacterium 429]|uniref:iron-sulfur cluster assembly scaffold protein n=1 Tax=Paenalcaligenes sp. Me52 TaxID=3392038 RepID=UPI0010920390|nr:iron-binding protein [Alcaligenaceae bacterium 429]
MRYNAQVESYFKQPEHAGVIAIATAKAGSALAGSVQEGAAIKLSLGVDESGVIQQARFQAYGCGATIAAAEYACRWAEGKPVEQLASLTSAELMQALDLPAVKLHSAILAVEVLRDAGSKIVPSQGE